jgi:hypothetical protein
MLSGRLKVLMSLAKVVAARPVIDPADDQELIGSNLMMDNQRIQRKALCSKCVRINDRTGLSEMRL